MERAAVVTPHGVTTLPPGDALLQIGRSVIAEEAAALALLAETLDEAAFAAAVAALVQTRGRVVVSGIGKSGHVARKTAATLASVGVPALFLHPADAAHGDLGMLVAGDVLVAMSNSGFSRELAPLLHYARTLGIAVIAIGGRPRSPLADAADIHLRLPTVAEAGPARLAPTTSSTMMMALGDALALTASACRAEAPGGFGRLHPSGSLGARFEPVRVLMHTGTGLPLVSVETPMREVIPTMTACSFGIAGVVADDRLVGVITDGDLRRHIDGLMVLTAGAVMTRQPVTIDPAATAEDALLLMTAHGITALFVIDPLHPGAPAGLVHVHDFARLGLG